MYKEELTDEFPNPHVAVQVQYTEGFSGTNLLVIKHEDAAVISDLMLGGTGENPTEIMDEIKLSAVQEAMNQMMGSAATSMSTVFQKKIDISPPSLDILNIQKGEGTELIPQDDVFVKVSFNLKVGTLIDSNIMQLLSISFAKSLVEELLVPSAEGTAASIEKESDLNEKQTEPPTAEYIQHEETQQAEPVHVPVDVQPASFSEFEHVSSPQGDSRNLDMLLDIPLQVTVELGRTKRTVQEILALSSGAIIELDKLAGEPVDILINSKLIAKGEVVVIDENFGVRVTDIISQRDRINKLK